MLAPLVLAALVALTPDARAWPPVAPVLVVAEAAGGPGQPGVGTRTRVLAGDDGQAEAATPVDPAEIPVDERPWKACRLTLVTLLNSGRNSQVVAREEHTLFHGERLDVARDIPVAQGNPSGDRQVLVRLRARVRAEVSRVGGVVYSVTSEAVLASAIGAEAAEVGQQQLRSAFLALGPGTQAMHEAFASTTLGLRVVLSLSVTPLLGEEDGMPAAPLQVDAALERFRVEALWREHDEWRVLEQADLTASRTRSARLQLGGFGTEGALLGDRAHPLGPGVETRELGGLPDSGFGDERRVELQRFDEVTRGVDVRELDEGYVAEGTIMRHRDDEPPHVTIRAKTRKMSKAKQEKIRQLLEIQAARRAAIERARSLPGGADVPAGYEHQHLTLHVTPLHASAQHVQVEIRLTGSVRLHEKGPATPVDARFVEELERGESFDVPVLELLEGGLPEYDYVLRITPGA